MAGSSSCLLAFSLGLLLTAWYLSGSHLSPAPSPPLINAGGTVYFDHAHLLTPSSVDDLIAIIKSAHENHRKVKVLGAGHSRSAIAHSSDVYVSLCNYTGVVRVDREKREVVVRAGTMLRDLNAVLKENGLALSSLPTLADQTIGGAIAVGSHGTGLKYGNMATFVTSFSFVSGTGELILVNADSNPDLFRAGLVSLGMIGVLTDITFECELSFNLRESITIHSLDHCLQNMGSLSVQSEHGKLWLEAHSGMCAVFDVRRTQDHVTQDQGVDLWDVKNRWSEPLLWAGSWFPSINPHLLPFLYNTLQIFTPYERVAVSHDVFVPPLYVPNNFQLEFIVAMDECVAALSEWRKIATNIHANLFTEVRYVKGDDFWLSPDYLQDSCHITVIIYNPSPDVMTSYFNSLLNAVSRQVGVAPRLHWSKYMGGVGVREVENMYPRLPDFARIRRQMDPHNLFMNHALREIFEFE